MIELLSGGDQASDFTLIANGVEFLSDYPSERTCIGAKPSANNLEIISVIEAP